MYLVYNFAICLANMRANCACPRQIEVGGEKAEEGTGEAEAEGEGEGGKGSGRGRGRGRGRG